MATLQKHQSDLVGYLSTTFDLNCVTFAPSYIAGTFETLDFFQRDVITETAKESGLTFAICVHDHTFLFISL